VWTGKTDSQQYPGNQCLGSGFLGSARFWLPGSESGSAKICGSTDPDPRGQNINQKLQKNLFYFLNPTLNF